MNISSIYAKYPKIITDSRNAQKNSIFFALKGESFDGNDFAAQALAAGCNYAVVDSPKVATDERFVLVDNVLSALQNLARERRKQLNIPVIAITGSNGKTTTKELIKCVLQTKYEIYATHGNLNNHIGVPLTILDIPPSTEIAIIEMGANHVGEIALLCDIAQPTCGLITNIGKAHLEGFGGLEGVKKAKKELYDYLNGHNGTVFHNENNPILSEILKDAKAETIGYGQICHGNVLSAAPYVHVDLRIAKKTYLVSTRIAGAYNLENILAACCVGKHFGISDKLTISAIEAYKPQNNRSQTSYTANNQLLLDYYNANPTSMRESLNNFFTQIEGAKMVILGDMFELGEESPQEHTEIVNLLISQKDATNVVVGKLFHEAAKNIPDVFSFSEMDELKKWLADNPPKKMFILLKGSRGMKLEQLIDFL